MSVDVAAAVAASVGYRDLVEAVKAAGVVLAKSVARISMVRVDVTATEVAVTATDVDVSVRTAVPAVETAGGSFLMHREELEKSLAAIAKGASKAQLDRLQVSVTYQREGASAVLEADGYGLPLKAGGDVDEYPAIGMSDHVPVERRVRREQFVTMFTRVAAAVGKDAILPLFCNVQILLTDAADAAGVQLYATDRYRAARGTVVGRGEGEAVALLPPITSKLLRLFRSTDLRISIASGWITLSDAAVSVQLRFDPDAQYPRLDYLLDFTPSGSAVVDLGQLRKAAARVAALQASLKRGGGARVTFADQSLTVAPTTEEGVPVTAPALSADTDLVEWVSAINPHYLVDALAHLEGDSVRIEVSQPGKPIRFTGSGEYVHLLQLMRH